MMAMHPTDTTEYRKAFIHYLRKGASIERSLKSGENAKPTTHYIWRTSGDGKVRASHAANNGKIFSWDNPPPTGHPGEDYGCRCKAEPYYGIIEESLNLVSERTIAILEYFRRLLSHVVRWEDRHFMAHFYVGGGRAVSLEEIGHFVGIKEFYGLEYLRRFQRQISKKAAIKAGWLLC